MRILEKIIIVFCIIGLGMKLFNVAGGSIFIVFGLTALSILYFALSWLLLRDRTTKTNNLGISITAGLALATACSGLMYKLQHWPGGSAMLIGGMVFLMPLLIICVMLYNRHKHTNEGYKRFYRGAMQRLAPFLFFSLLFAFIPDNTLIRFEYRHDPELARLYIRARENPENDQYWRDLEDYEISRYYQSDTLK
jgi:F0F1-type ATP synthase assembly protein I